MPLDAFTEAMWAGLVRGDEQFAVGFAQEWVTDGFEAERTRLFQQGQVQIKAAISKFLKSNQQ